MTNQQIVIFLQKLLEQQYVNKTVSITLYSGFQGNTGQFLNLSIEIISPK